MKLSPTMQDALLIYYRWEQEGVAGTPGPWNRRSICTDRTWKALLSRDLVESAGTWSTTDGYTWRLTEIGREVVAPLYAEWLEERRRRYARSRQLRKQREERRGSEAALLTVAREYGGPHHDDLLREAALRYRRALDACSREPAIDMGSLYNSPARGEEE